MDSKTDITDIATNPATYGVLVLVGLVVLVAYMGRKIWLDSSNKECERLFGFWPQRPLTFGQISSMEKVIIRRRQEYVELVNAKISREKEGRTTEAGLLGHEVEYASMNLSITLHQAKVTARRYADNPDTIVNRFDYYAHQG